MYIVIFIQTYTYIYVYIYLYINARVSNMCSSILHSLVILIANVLQSIAVCYSVLQGVTRFWACTLPF